MVYAIMLSSRIDRVDVHTSLCSYAVGCVNNNIHTDRVCAAAFVKLTVSSYTLLHPNLRFPRASAVRSSGNDTKTTSLDEISMRAVLPGKPESTRQALCTGSWGSKQITVRMLLYCPAWSVWRHRQDWPKCANTITSHTSAAMPFPY